MLLVLKTQMHDQEKQVYTTTMQTLPLFRVCGLYGEYPFWTYGVYPFPLLHGSCFCSVSLSRGWVKDWERTGATVEAYLLGE